MGYSKLKIPKICQFCKQPFEAKTMYTVYCSKECANKADKQKQKEKQSEDRFQREVAEKTAIISEILSRPYISVAEATQLFGISRNTIHRLIKKGKIPARNMGERLTRISRTHLEVMFAPIQQADPIPSQPKEYSIDECYTMKEIQAKFGVSEKTLYLTIKRLNIPKFPKGKYVYVPKELIDNIFAPNNL